jgi:hypothetical protein
VRPGETLSLGGNPGVRWFVYIDDGRDWPESKIAEGEYRECETTTTTTLSVTTTTAPETTTSTVSVTTTTMESESTQPPASVPEESPNMPELVSPPTSQAASSTSGERPDELPFTGIGLFPLALLATTLIAGGIGLLRKEKTSNK